MPIRSTFFGVTTLSGDDAEKFSRQVAYGRPNQSAVNALQRGKALLRELNTKGYIEIGLDSLRTGGQAKPDPASPQESSRTE